MVMPVRDVRPRVQISGPLPLFEYDPGVTAGAGRAPITAVSRFPQEVTTTEGRCSWD